MADFSIILNPIIMKFYKHYFPAMGRLPWEFHWKILYNLFNMQ